MGFDREPRVAEGRGVAARCVDAERPVWTRDLFADDYAMPTALREAILAIGSRAVLAAPLNVKSQVVGALVVAYAEPRDFEEREVALLQAFADQAALALENAQLYASARDNLARLRETQAQLVQAAKLGALGQLVSGVAHELNNPLSVIIGYGQLLLSPRGAAAAAPSRRADGVAGRPHGEDRPQPALLRAPAAARAHAGRPAGDARADARAAPQPARALGHHGAPEFAQSLPKIAATPSSSSRCS